MNLLIKNGRVIDPATNTDQVADVLMEDGIIRKVAPSIDVEGVNVFDAQNCWVMPGFVDLHVHLRDPGLTYKESIETGAKAAVHGGFTTMLAMPNTLPVADHAEVIEHVHQKAKDAGLAKVLQVGAITKGQDGEELADISEMVAAGSPAISEDGKSVKDARLYLKAMKIAAKHGIPVLAHCEDTDLVNKGVMNAGEKAKELGLPGISNDSENAIIARDMRLAKEAGAKLHLCHCSTKESVILIALGKAMGVPVTAEVCPHHFTLSTDDILVDEGNYKMNPPLRDKQDVEALKEGLKTGIIDVIATDHAPHSKEEKEGSMRNAAFGIIGLETAAALVMTELVDKGVLTPMQMAEKMSYNPARIIGLDRGSLMPGKAADVVIFDPNEEYTIEETDFYSKSKNSPFIGRKVKGRVIACLVGGKLAYD